MASKPAQENVMFPNKKVLGLGVAGLDFIASVDAYPKPDDKIRSSGFAIMGGGNVANTLTCLSRLGVPVAIASKLGESFYVILLTSAKMILVSAGKDANGASILKDLQEEGIDTSPIVSKEGLDSPFTYVIVDTSQHTRTCIHTPIQEELLPEEVQAEWLEGVVLLHLDSRNTRAAIRLAELAIEKGIPVSLDIEKDRPHVRELLPLADYVFTNSRYPGIYLPENDVLKGMVALLEQGRARMVVTTLGAEGSLVLRRHQGEAAVDGADGPQEGGLVTIETHAPGPHARYEILRCKAQRIDTVVDTTGAGDAFIGGFIYSLVNGLPNHRGLELAAAVAASKCQQLGARRGLPWRSAMDPRLLAAASGAAAVAT